jgi:hypothetical protein
MYIFDILPCYVTERQRSGLMKLNENGRQQNAYGEVMTIILMIIYNYVSR